MAEAALLERGAVPADVTKSLALWLRAKGVTKYFSSWPSLGLPPEYPAYEIVPPFSQAVKDIIEVSVSAPEVQNGASGLPATDRSLMRQPIPAWTHQEHLSLSTEEVTLLLSIVKGDDIMSFDSSKRETLRRIATLVLAASHSSPIGIGSYALGDPEPWERLARAELASSPSPLLNTATLEYFEDLLRISWQLCDQNQFVPAEGVLMSFLPQLLSLPKQESRTALEELHKGRIT